MKVFYSLLLLGCLFLIAGCQNDQENTMVLLDEPIKEINVSKSGGIGDMNQDILFSFNDKQSIRVFEKGIRTAVKQQSDMKGIDPEYDVMVEYDGGLPAHAIHLWLGEEDEESTLMYMVGEGETYLTSSRNTNRLRELLLPQQ
jgi:hypothetical protein